MKETLEIGLLIIGDEILSGKRNDKHFSQSKEILHDKGLMIDWVFYVRDNLQDLEKFLRMTLKSNATVFSFGGIGSTPDDLTRQACANALGVRLEPNAEAIDLIKKSCEGRGLDITTARLEMGSFPENSDIIPNEVNGFPGFSMKRHFFFPGFPNMAKPMMQWVLEEKYSGYFSDCGEIEFYFKVSNLFESSISDSLKSLEKIYPLVSFYSLPSILREKVDKESISLELGIKYRGENFKMHDVQACFEGAKRDLRQEIQKLGGVIMAELTEKR